jgi:hypothetical protein
VIRWVVLTFVVLVLLDGLRPWLRRLGLGRLPGDFEFRALGRLWHVPLGSTLVLSALFSVLAHWL